MAKVSQPYGMWACWLSAITLLARPVNRKIRLGYVYRLEDIEASVIASSGLQQPFRCRMSKKYYIALDSLTHPRVLLLLVGGGHYQLAGYRVGEGDGRSNWAGRKRTKAVDRIYLHRREGFF